MKKETKVKNFNHLRNTVNAILQIRAEKRKQEVECKLRSEAVFKSSKAFSKIYKTESGVIVGVKRKRFAS